ncbi:phage tail protein X [Microvirga flocculans]|uniref:Phage tail protein X n=1 Tax=Microvirga flocculans TaxID=217168 RepID=A0A7W6IJI9_9HYPH|nr:tail protein X [Microvirga flocculans]MBB4041999.1 phage tail protein X [Microvirga flocculans]
MSTETLPPVESAFTTLDLLLYRRFGREVPGLVEKTLDRNPGLADHGPYLPIGTQVTVEIPEPATVRPVRLLRLTD